MIRRVPVALAALALSLAAALPALAAQGPTKLESPSVSPAQGTTATTISFAVTYRSVKDLPPEFVRVEVAGSTHDMRASGTDWKAGVRFTWRGLLPAGTHAVKFLARDAEKFVDELAAGAVVIEAATPTSTPTAAPTPTPQPTTGPTPTPPTSPTPAPTSTPSPTSPPPAPTPTPAPTIPGAPTSEPGSTSEPGPTAGASDGADPSFTPGPGAASGVGGGPTGGSTGGSTRDPADGSAADRDDPQQGGGGLDAIAAAVAGIGRAILGDATGRNSWAAAPGGLEPDPGPGLPTLTTMLLASAGVAAWLSFALFGRRRRDDETPDASVLAAAAATGAALAGSAALAPTPMPLPDPEAGMPRWRRPSLLEARKTDPVRSPVVARPRLSFATGVVHPDPTCERRLVRYAVVELLDRPDEVYAARIGEVEAGDEVEVRERRGLFVEVICPDGRTGWLHRTTLGELVGSPAPRAIEPEAGEMPGGLDAAGAMAALLAARGLR